MHNQKDVVYLYNKIKQIEIMTNQEIKVGQFVSGHFKYSCIDGVVKEVKAKTIIVNTCNYIKGKYVVTNNEVQLNRNRLTQIGLSDGQSIA